MDRNALIRALRDTAQSASNAIASNVSGPVDLIAAGLRGVGLPIPQNPVGGSQWMAERGLTAPVQQGVAQVIGDTIGLAGPALVANFAPQIASALNRGAQNLAAPRTLHPEAGAIVWHGSPHKFDRFDSSKIGTGEGAQAYGHGLYLAENAAVAKGYIPKTAHNDTVRKFLDALPEDADFDEVLELVGTGRFTPEQDRVLRALSADDWLGFDYPSQAISQAYRKSLVYNFDPSPELVDAVRNVGSLYKVDLPDEHIAKMLDWDKPLSQQSNQVQAFFSNHPRPPGPDTTLGEWLRPRVAEGSMIEQDLVQAGIPGIRYLDGFSRNSGGQGTSNFVVFPGNENILQILERNGQPLGLMGVR